MVVISARRRRVVYGEAPPARTLLALTDRQLGLIKHAASALPVDQRDQFLRDIAKRLAGEPSDAAVAEAVNVTLNRTSVFLTDSKERTPPP